MKQKIAVLLTVCLLLFVSIVPVMAQSEAAAEASFILVTDDGEEIFFESEVALRAYLAEEDGHMVIAPAYEPCGNGPGRHMSKTSNGGYWMEGNVIVGTWAQCYYCGGYEFYRY